MMQANAHDIVEVVAKVKKSVVGIGVFDPINAPRAMLHGSGFVVANGQYVVTNYHVISKPLDPDSKQRRVIFVGSGSRPLTLNAEIIGIDEEHDLALLKVNRTLEPLTLSEGKLVPDGTAIAFTGFPIGAVLGLYPATHTGIVSASTPVVNPTENSRQLDVARLKRLRDPYYVYQLDATAYPGNSGSAVYELNNGNVVAVINKVFVKTTKEAVLSDPSGITYAIPVKYVRQLLQNADIALD